MNNYKINIEYGEEDINHIFIKVLNKELKKYLKNICQNREPKGKTTCTSIVYKDRENKK